jgi:hypothetical protein
MCETGHSHSGRDEMRQALRLLEEALSRYGLPPPAEGRAEGAHRAMSQALQMMRREAETLRSALAAP